MSSEIFSVRHCDKCGAVMENTWTVIIWKSGNTSDLCKKCTADFNRWLKEGKERSVEEML